MLNGDGSVISSSMFVYEYGWHLFQVEWKEMSNLEVWVKDTNQPHLSLVELVCLWQELVTWQCFGWLLSQEKCFVRVTVQLSCLVISYLRHVASGLQCLANFRLSVSGHSCIIFSLHNSQFVNSTLFTGYRCLK